jgi:hypothetical protein
MSLPKNMDKALIHSMHIRGMIQTLKEGFGNLPAVVYIYNKCLDGEKKYQRAHPESYNELFDAFNNTRIAYSKEFNKTMIATDTAMTEMYYDQEESFKKYFKLKSKRFEVLFNRFGSDDNLEDETFVAMDRLKDIIVKELELMKWRRWVADNNRRRMKEPVVEGNIISETER